MPMSTADDANVCQVPSLMSNHGMVRKRPLLDTARIVRDGVLLSVVASTYLLFLLRFNPRIFLGHFPKEIRDIVPPKSEKERRMSILLGLLIGAPFALATRNSGKSLLPGNGYSYVLSGSSGNMHSIRN